MGVTRQRGFVLEGNTCVCLGLDHLKSNIRKGRICSLFVFVGGARSHMGVAKLYFRKMGTVTGIKLPVKTYHIANNVIRTTDNLF